MGGAGFKVGVTGLRICGWVLDAGRLRRGYGVGDRVTKEGMTETEAEAEAGRGGQRRLTEDADGRGWHRRRRLSSSRMIRIR